MSVETDVFMEWGPPLKITAGFFDQLDTCFAHLHCQQVMQSCGGDKWPGIENDAGASFACVWNDRYAYSQVAKFMQMWYEMPSKMGVQTVRVELRFATPGMMDKLMFNSPVHADRTGYTRQERDVALQIQGLAKSLHRLLKPLDTVSFCDADPEFKPWFHFTNAKCLEMEFVPLCEDEKWNDYEYKYIVKEVPPDERL